MKEKLTTLQASLAEKLKSESFNVSKLVDNYDSEKSLGIDIHFPSSWTEYDYIARTFRINISQSGDDPNSALLSFEYNHSGIAYWTRSDIFEPQFTLPNCTLTPEIFAQLKNQLDTIFSAVRGYVEELDGERSYKRRLRAYRARH